MAAMVMTRRDLIRGAAALSAWGTEIFAAEKESRLSVEGYIFQQYAARQKKSLGEVLAEVIPMARVAGFRNVELNQGFFTPELRAKTLDLLHANGLRMPSVYVGGVMHEAAAAAKTTELALEIAELCKPFGCAGVVNNPSPKPKAEEKTDAELILQGQLLNLLGGALATKGSALRIHNHTPEMVNGAREFRSTLRTTDPKNVKVCLDIDWVRQGDQDPYALLLEAGSRVTEIHVRNAKDKLWLETFGAGDVDYSRVAAQMRRNRQVPLIVVELAWRDNTAMTRGVQENLTLGRVYAEKVFGVKA